MQAALQVECRAEDQALPTPPQTAQQSPQQSVQQAAPEDVRFGGTIERSYNYHRQHLTSADMQPMRSQIELGGIPQANGWYNYGFPMRSYRYGWFGAERPHPSARDVASRVLRRQGADVVSPRVLIAGTHVRRCFTRDLSPALPGVDTAVSTMPKQNPRQSRGPMNIQIVKRRFE